MSELKINSWFGMLYKPRETIRRIVDYNPYHRMLSVFLVLSLVIYPASLVFAFFLTGSFLASPLLALLLTFIYLIIIFFSLFMYAVSLWVSGKLIDGKAPVSHLMAAVFWTSLHTLWIYGLACLFLILLFLGGDDLTRGESALSHFSLLSFIILTLLYLFWFIVVLLKSISEVQRFSPLKATLNLILAYFVSIILYLIVLIPLIIIFSITGLIISAL